MVDVSRRRFLEGLSASTLPLVSGCLAPTSTDAGEHPVDGPVSEWPSFRGDRHNTGFARGAADVGSDPSIAWSFEADGPFWGSPVVAGDTVYVGCADRSVYALDADGGAVRWEFPTSHRVEATPVVDDGTVYVGSYDRHMYAIDAETGAERWNRGFNGLVRGSPTIHRDAVLVGVGCHNLACAWYAEEADVSEEGWIYSLDSESGAVNWRRSVDDEVVSTPAVRNDTVYVGASDGSLYALDATSGDVEWTYETRDMIWSSPAVAFDTVYFADWSGYVHAVDAADGSLRWTTNTVGDYISGSVAVDEDAVYVGHTPYNSLDDPTQRFGKLFKLDRTNGNERWRFETAALEMGSSPVVTDDVLYVGTHGPSEADGLGVHAVSTDGEEEWFLHVGGRGVGSSPALADGTLYFGGTDDRLYAVE